MGSPARRIWVAGRRLSLGCSRRGRVALPARSRRLIAPLRQQRANMAPGCAARPTRQPRHNRLPPASRIDLCRIGRNSIGHGHHHPPVDASGVRVERGGADAEAVQFPCGRAREKWAAAACAQRSWACVISPLPDTATFMRVSEPLEVWESASQRRRSRPKRRPRRRTTTSRTRATAGHRVRVATGRHGWRRGGSAGTRRPRPRCWPQCRRVRYGQDGARPRRRPARRGRPTRTGP
jgi:hypothetical protein